MTAPTSRKILLAGATGLIGREILRGLLADPTVTRVTVLGRRAPASSDPRIDFQAVDFAKLPTLGSIDECYIALGTTIKVAGSQQAFRAVDFDAVVATARAARVAGATRLGVVSAMGANPKSNVFYSRVKGEMEEALTGLGFGTLVIARPSMLAGDREALGQPVRSGEVLALKVSNKLGWLIPRNYRSIPAAHVAHAMLRAVPTSRGKRVLLSGEMRAA